MVAAGSALTCKRFFDLIIDPRISPIMRCSIFRYNYIMVEDSDVRSACIPKRERKRSPVERKTSVSLH